MLKTAFGVLLVSVSLAVISCKEERPAPNIEHKIVPGMAYVPAGNFVMGSKGTVERQGQDGGDGVIGEQVGVDELPQRKAALEKGFYIDILETTNAEYKKFVDAAGHRTPDNPTHDYDPYIWKNGTYPKGLEEYPVALVNYDDAAAYCKWQGKRLPTEEEWEKSCRGEDGARWPWGMAFDQTKANTRALELKRSAIAGGFPDDKSRYGVLDMSGNVREWTSSWYKPYPGSSLKRETFGEQFRVIRGGSWVHMPYPESRCASRGISLPDVRHRSIGVRCAKDE